MRGVILFPMLTAIGCASSPLPNSHDDPPRTLSIHGDFEAITVPESWAEFARHNAGKAVGSDLSRVTSIFAKYVPRNDVARLIAAGHLPDGSMFSVSWDKPGRAVEGIWKLHEVSRGPPSQR
jgi:hypothetical protein